MEFIYVVAAVGIVGGAVMAMGILAFDRRLRRAPSVVVSGHLDAAPVINMASIKVEGVGGIGLVAMSVGVAIAIPAIGGKVLLGGLLGGACAAVMIAKRRRKPLPSSGARPGANTTLAIDDISPIASTTAPRTPGALLAAGA